MINCEQEVSAVAFMNRKKLPVKKFHYINSSWFLGDSSFIRSDDKFSDKAMTRSYSYESMHAQLPNLPMQKVFGSSKVFAFVRNPTKPLIDPIKPLFAFNAIQICRIRTFLREISPVVILKSCKRHFKYRARSCFEIAFNCTKLSTNGKLLWQIFVI